METLRLSDARQRIERMYGDAKKDLTATKYSVGMGEPYLVWSYKLSQILGAIEHPESESLEAPELVRRICDGFLACGVLFGCSRRRIYAELWG